MCSAPEFCRRNWTLLVGKLGTLYNLAKNVVVFGTKRRTFKNIYSKNLKHLLAKYTKLGRSLSPSFSFALRAA